MIEFGRETRFKGLAISGGRVLARTCLFNENRHSNLPMYKVEGEGADREKSRVIRATEIASGQLDDLRERIAERIGKSEAEIFVAQKMILNDESLQKEICEVIDRDSVNAETAVQGVLDQYESRIMEMDSEYIKERATDLGEVRRRILDVLGNINASLQCAGAEHCQKGSSRVVVAEELTPSLTLDLDTEHTVAFVTEKGGVTSHASILARSLGVPAVSGLKNIHALLMCGTEVIVDGDAGELIVWPTDETKAGFPELRTSAISAVDSVEPVADFRVLANISLSSDIADVRDALAEGIGLYRTEFEFIAARKVLTEDEQFERYSSVVKQMEGNPVYFRMLDVGGDKDLPFLEIPRDEKPYLGFRGARFLLGRNELLSAQARALARASEFGPVYVMYPMVVEVEQFLRLRDAFTEAVDGSGAGEIKHGVMFEVPSSALEAKELLVEADFGSIGSNDLIQYLFAVDRNNDMVAYDYNPDRPVFWNVLRNIADAAKETGRELSICGELAGDPSYVAKLKELGIRNVSVSPRLIGSVRRAAGEDVTV